MSALHLDEDQLASLSAFLSERVGLHFSPVRHCDLLRGMQKTVEELGYKEMQHCVDDVLSQKMDDDTLQVVVRNLTIGETYFFRDPDSFTFLETKVLPDLVAQRMSGVRHIRIWSAGCSTGEEPYSIAISMSRTVSDLDRLHTVILATDINKTSLEKAQQGRYGSWSFRTTPPATIEQYFQPVGSEHQVKDGIRKLVNFSYHNLASNQPIVQNRTFQNMDVIFCRNVLIYFVGSKCQQIVGQLSECLAPGGWLIMSSNDSSHIIGSMPKCLSREGTNVFRKQE